MSALLASLFGSLFIIDRTGSSAGSTQGPIFSCTHYGEIWQGGADRIADPELRSSIKPNMHAIKVENIQKANDKIITHHKINLLYVLYKSKRLSFS